MKVQYTPSCSLVGIVGVCNKAPDCTHMRNCAVCTYPLYFRSVCNVLCNIGWSKMQLRNWWGCHLDILQKLDLRKPMNATDALELLLCLTRRDHWCSVFLNVWEIKQFLDITVLCYVINNTKWWRLIQTQLYSMLCCF